MEGGSWTCTNFILKEKGRYWKIFHTPFLCIWTCLSYLWWTSLVAQMVKHLPTMRETQVQSLGQEDPLKKEMATHSSILAWKIPWTEEAGRLQFMGSHRVGHDWSDLAAAAAAASGSDSKESAWTAGDPGSIPGSGRSLGEGNGNPLQCSCLGNLINRGAWQA